MNGNNADGQVHVAGVFWNRRIAHFTMTVVRRMVNLKNGMRNTDAQSMQDSQTCVLYIQTKRKTTSDPIQKFPNEAFHADICGPVKTITQEGNKYFLMLTLASQHYTKAHLLMNRKNIVEYFYNYVHWTTTHTDL